MLYSCSINSQRIVESVVLYKHSFRARKVVQMMDLRERREEKRALALIRVGHPKQKKEGKIARLKNYIKSSYRSRCCCCREEKRRKERERVNYGATGNTRPFLLLLFYSVPFLLLAFVATTTTTKFDCVMTHRLGFSFVALIRRRPGLGVVFFVFSPLFFLSAFRCR